MTGIMFYRHEGEYTVTIFILGVNYSFIIPTFLVSKHFVWLESVLNVLCATEQMRAKWTKYCEYFSKNHLHSYTTTLREQKGHVKVV